MKDLQVRTEGLTLEIEARLAAPRGVVWRCWTEPELFKRWHCPKPWFVSEADFDLRPGGRMKSVMRGPEGERIDNEGAWLEVVDGARLTFTDAYGEGFVPRETAFMTGELCSLLAKTMSSAAADAAAAAPAASIRLFPA